MTHLSDVVLGCFLDDSASWMRVGADPATGTVDLAVGESVSNHAGASVEMDAPTARRLIAELRKAIAEADPPGKGTYVCVSSFVPDPTEVRVVTYGTRLPGDHPDVRRHPERFTVDCGD